MLENVPAIFRDGVFHPATPYNLPNESRVVLQFEKPVAAPPVEPDLEKRRQSLKRAVERMRNNPLPADTPPITRDWIYDRS